MSDVTFDDFNDLDKPFSVRIIIEGPDCVGKDTFIDRMKTFIAGDPKHFGLNILTVEQVKLTPEGVPIVIERNGVFETETEVVITPKYANAISYSVIHPTDSSVEAKEFIAKMDSGEITDQAEIAKEYLQIHYDLERLAQDRSLTHNVVVMNRSLVSYYAMQLQALGYEEHRENWKKLWNFSKQKDAFLVRLTAPEEVIKERLAKRNKGQATVGVESLYMDKWKAIDAGFALAQATLFPKSSMTIDTTEGDHVIDACLKNIFDWVAFQELVSGIEPKEPTIW